VNIVDIAAIAIIALSVLLGFYRGFIQSLLSMGACLLSLVGSFFLYPVLANGIQADQSIIMNLIHYTDASSRIGNLELAMQNVASMTSEGLSKVLENVNLPLPLSELLRFNLENGVFSASGIQTVSDYVNHTILTFSINVLSFLVCFLVLYIVLSILINLLRAVFNFPLLKQLDWLFGGVFGLLRGVVLCYAAFIVVPLILTITPIETVRTLFDESMLSAFFNNGNLTRMILNRRIN